MRATRREALLGLCGVVAASAARPSGGDAVLPHGLSLLPRREQLPDIAFHDAEGREIEFRDLRGKPAVLLFWATWCGICYGEMPKLDALARRIGDRVHIVALSTDVEGIAKVGPYFDRRGLDGLTPYFDRSSVISHMLGIRGVPTALVIDRDGWIVAAGAGRVNWDDGAAESYLAALA